MSLRFENVLEFEIEFEFEIGLEIEFEFVLENRVPQIMSKSLYLVLFFRGFCRTFGHGYPDASNIQVV